MPRSEHHLAPGFRRLDHYQATGYSLLPFQSIRLVDDKYLLVNIAGDFLSISRADLPALIDRKFPRDHPLYAELRSRQFIVEGEPRVQLELLAAQYRTRQAAIAEFTALHIFVVTLRCDHSCHYCQVSRVSADRAAYDMTPEKASKAIDLMLRSPSRYLKVEFQGGEPLLNFELIRRVVLEVKAKAQDRRVEFVIASNLAFLTEDMLQFAREHAIQFSCSLDGPKDLHNRNRPRPATDSYDRTVEGIRRIREALGHDAVSALMTTTASSLSRPEAIIDEYVQQGFASVFLRWISPFGFAVRSAAKIGYDTERFLEFYKRGLDYIITLNLQGTHLREEYAAIFLRKILTPYGTGYVDLQSPAGMGLSVLVYNYDGKVYASDESRMLAEMGDRTLCLGTVDDSYEQLFLESPLLEMSLVTMTEGVPGCSECAFASYCGTDPVFNHATQGDIVGHRPTSAFCRRNMEIIRHLFCILEEGGERSRVLKTWV